MIFIIAGLLGVICGLLIPYNLQPHTVPYVAVALLAALDSVFGALLAYFNKKFNMNVFVTGLVSNAIMAVLLTGLGELLGLELTLVILIVFGVRIFNNMAAIRRITVDIYFHRRAREQERALRLEAEQSEKEPETDSKKQEKSSGEQEEKED